MKKIIAADIDGSKYRAFMFLAKGLGVSVSELTEMAVAMLNEKAEQMFQDALDYPEGLQKDKAKLRWEVEKDG